MRNSSGYLETALRRLIYGALVVVSIFWMLRPFNDPDFFWHLKAGEWTWQQREAPAEDPFNYMSRGVEPAGQRFVLTSYWLIQVVFFAIHSLLGMPGIFVFRSLIALLYVLALLKLRRGDPVVHAALVLCYLPLFYNFYPLDRPQALSFLFFAVLLILFERERSSPAVTAGWKSCLPLPVLMLVWANVHGGHVVGQITIVLFIALEGVKFAHPALRPVGRDRYRRLLIVGVAGLIASLANPNSYHAVQIALAPATNMIRNLEYLSTMEFFRERHEPLLFIFWGAVALAAVTCLSTIAKPDITLLVILVGTGYWGFSHIRYVPFFMVAALPVIGQFLSAERVGIRTRRLLVAGSVLLATWFSKAQLPSRERASLALRVNGNIYPEKAANFVLANDLKGNLYNTYFWGGYLLWRLGPARKVFVDGRVINALAVYQSLSINSAATLTGHAVPSWKSLLRQKGVGYLIIPRVPKYKGTVFDQAGNLARALLDDPDWVPVHSDTIALVFVLRMPEHREVIAQHAIPKERILAGI